MGYLSKYEPSIITFEENLFISQLLTPIDFNDKDIKEVIDTEINSIYNCNWILCLETGTFG